MQSTFGDMAWLVVWLVLVRENSVTETSFIGFANMKSMVLEYIPYHLIYGGVTLLQCDSFRNTNLKIWSRRLQTCSEN